MTRTSTATTTDTQRRTEASIRTGEPHGDGVVPSHRRRTALCSRSGTFVYVTTLLAVITMPASAQAIEPSVVEEAALTAEALDLALAVFVDEPSIDDVLNWAREAGLFDPTAADAAMERARLSALLPQVRVGVRRGLGWDALARQSTTTDSSSLAAGEDLSVVGTLVFRLDRLVFASEETSLLRERRALEEARTTLVAQIVALYFERRRLLVERELVGAPDLLAELRILEIEALIDAVTGARFGRALRGEDADAED